MVDNETTYVSPEPAATENTPLMIPRAIMQLALVLDSILSMQPPDGVPALREVQHGGTAAGTTADFRELGAEDLTHLGMHLALTTPIVTKGCSGPSDPRSRWRLNHQLSLPPLPF